jgi:hypothetical protein
MTDEFLTIGDLAVRFGVQPQTIHKYRLDSKLGRRYADRPFPLPDRTVGTMPVWLPGRLPEISEWFTARRSTGRPRKVQE